MSNDTSPPSKLRRTPEKTPEEGDEIGRASLRWIIEGQSRVQIDRSMGCVSVLIRLLISQARRCIRQGVLCHSGLLLHAEWGRTILCCLSSGDENITPPEAIRNRGFHSFPIECLARTHGERLLAACFLCSASSYTSTIFGMFQSRK